MSSSAKRWVVVAAAVLLTASCSSGGGSDHSSASTTTAPGASQPCSVATNARRWVRSDLRPVSQPFVAGCNFIVYDASGGQLRVVALDAQTGRTKWQMNTSASTVTPGVAPALAVIGNVVAFFKGASGSSSAAIVGVDASTGAIKWTSPSVEFNGWPAPCPGDVATVCATGSVGDQTRLVRLTAANGRALASPVISADSGGRDLGPGLFDPGTRTPDQLLAVDGGSVAWKEPLASVFPGRGLSSDNGWNFDRVPAAGLFVGSVGGTPLSQTATSAVLDLASGMTSGFRIATGAPAWKDAGSQYVCTVLPCAGSVAPTGTGVPRPPTFGVRMRGAGTANVRQGGAPVLSPDAHFALEGFDLKTGKTTWTFDLGRSLALVQGTSPPQLDAKRVVVALPSGTTVLNLETGAHSALASAATLWCQTSTTYKVKNPYAANNGESIDTYTGENALFPCDQRAHAVATPDRVPAFVGPSVGGTIAWSQTNKVIGVPVAGAAAAQV